VSQRAHGLRVGQVERRAIVKRTRAALAFVSQCVVECLAGRCFADAFFASPLIVDSIFGSHVSKYYARKSRFDKSSKHFFRETRSVTADIPPAAPAARSFDVGCRVHSTWEAAFMQLKDASASNPLV
jgi:hypothetical protein